MVEDMYLVTDIADKKENSILGLIIKNIDPDRLQKHTGFIFIKDNVPVLAHFGGPYAFLYGPKKIDDKYAMYWIDFEKMPESIAIPLINELEQISTVNRLHHGSSSAYMLNAEYGIKSSFKSTIQNGRYIPDAQSLGDSLTCATFVNCLFEQFGFPILDISSWEIPPEDIEWQEKTINWLESTNFLQAKFIEVQKSSIGKFPRIKPEQMVGACIKFNYQLVSYVEANMAGKIVSKELEALNY